MIDAKLIAFTGIAALLTVTPGADTMLVIRSVISRGRRAGFQTTLGICCGLFVHAILSGLGVSLILVRSANLFQAVKLAGAGYLIYLGAKSIWSAWRDRAAVSPEIEAGATDPKTGWQSFLEGLLNNVLNPKVAVFYLAFLPQFISPGDHVFGRSMVLAAIHGFEGVLWLSGVTLLLSSLRQYLLNSRIRAAIESFTGAVLIAFGLRLAFEKR